MVGQLVVAAQAPLDDLLAGPADETPELYIKVNRIVPSLVRQTAEDGEGDFWVDEQGKPVIRIVKGGVDPASPEAKHQVDALAGATLTSNGVDASRLVGPVGYGESRPLEPTPQTFPACKSEVNRRTELNVQN